MSIPRAATSVATIVRTLPSRNLSRIRSRWFCFKSPCKPATSKRCFCNRCTARSTIRFVLQNMMHWSSSPIRARRRPRAQSLFARPIEILNRSIGGTSSSSWLVITNSGLLVNSFAASRISCGKVAENNSVCSRDVVRSRIHRISGRNPISSMRSASSRQNISIFDRSRCPRSDMSMTRPGVPTITSTPDSRPRACFSRSVPP